MAVYIGKRLLSLIPILLMVGTIVFFIIHLTPGDPASIMLGPEATQEQVQMLRTELGLDKHVLIRFVEWLGNAATGDLGNSIFMKMPVSHAIAEHIGPTISLTLCAQILALIIALPLGIFAAKKKGTSTDQSVMVFSFLGISMPSFLIGLFLILIFAVELRWLPASGYQPLDEGLFNHLKYMILPAISLGFMQAALIARMTRATMLEVLNQSFIEIARAKGVHEFIIVIKHAFRNAAIPILTVVGQSFALLIGGATVTETVFNIPGIGQLIVNSVERRDYEVIQGIVLVIAIIYVAINLLIDVLYGVLDPRVRVKK